MAPADAALQEGDADRRHLLGGAALDRDGTAGSMPLIIKVKVSLQATKVGEHFGEGPARVASMDPVVVILVLVPGAWTVDRGHRLQEVVEREIRTTIPTVTVFTHLESLDDPSSWDDTELDRDGQQQDVKEHERDAGERRSAGDSPS
jgi:hypothetical protein